MERRLLIFALALMATFFLIISCGGGGDNSSSSGSGSSDGSNPPPPPVTQPYNSGGSGQNRLLGTVYMWCEQSQKALPQPNAQVSVDGTNLCVITDGNGNYCLEGNTPTGQVTVRVTEPGGKVLSRPLVFDGSEVSWCVVLGVNAPFFDFEGIISETNGQGLEGVRVSIGDTGIVTYTSKGGQFLISRPPNDMFLVRIEKAGYITQEQELDFRYGNRLTWTLILDKLP